MLDKVNFQMLPEYAMKRPSEEMSDILWLVGTTFNG